YGSITDVSHGENAGDVGLEQEGFPIGGPTSRALTVARQVRSGQDKSTCVPLHKAIEPTRARRGADEHEQRTRRYPIDRSGRAAGDRERFQLLLTVYGDQLRPIL